MYRKVFVAKEVQDLTITLPEELLNKEVEIIAFELQHNDASDRGKKLAEAKAFFKTVAVDMSGFKFNREEANER